MANFHRLSVVTRQQRGDRPAGTVFDEPQFFAFALVVEDLQIIEARVRNGGVLQDGETCEDRLATVHLNRGRRRWPAPRNLIQVL